jgi:hypothetical protein
VPHPSPSSSIISRVVKYFFIIVVFGVSCHHPLLPHLLLTITTPNFPGRQIIESTLAVPSYEVAGWKLCRHQRQLWPCKSKAIAMVGSLDFVVGCTAVVSTRDGIGGVVFTGRSRRRHQAPATLYISRRTPVLLADWRTVPKSAGPSGIRGKCHFSLRKESDQVVSVQKAEILRIFVKLVFIDSH